MATLEVVVTPAQPGQFGARPLGEFLTLPEYNQPEWPVPELGLSVPVPEGSIGVYLQNQADQWGGLTAWVKVSVTVRPEPGEIWPTPNYQNSSRRLLTPQMLVAGLADGTIRFDYPLSEEQKAELERGEIPSSNVE